MSEPSVLLLEARAALERTHPLLLDPSPSNVDQCAAHLACATRNVQALHEVLSASPASGRAIKESAELLRRELKIISALLDRAATYHSGLLQEMVVASQQTPPAVPPPAARRLHLEG